MFFVTEISGIAISNFKFKFSLQSKFRKHYFTHFLVCLTVLYNLSAPRGNRNRPLGAGRIEWWVFTEAHSAIYPLISPNLGKWSTDPSARNGMRDGPSKSTRHLGPPPPISLKFDREAAYRIRTARNRREPAPAAPLTAPILTRRARFRALAP